MVGDATLAPSRLDLGLIDEIRVNVTPLALGGGKALFKDLKQRHVLKLMRNKSLKSGRVCLTYAIHL